MKVLYCRNVHEALPLALDHLIEYGAVRQSRNGPVLVAPGPVATEYSHPSEKVLFWPERDANPAFHLYESLWMLSGRQDVAPLAHYVKRILDYSDDGKILHDAYGYRWRNKWTDQLMIIIKRLRENPEDRRCVLQMWNTKDDLDNPGRAVPCNLTATFQRDIEGNLDLVVFNRSNDIIWGAYGANAVQFGTLLEYMALKIGCPVGTYTQISINWHAYLDTLEKLRHFQRETSGLLAGQLANPYVEGDVKICPMGLRGENLDYAIRALLSEVDGEFRMRHKPSANTFCENAYHVLHAFELWSTLPAPERFERAFDSLGLADPTIDWVVAMKEWLQRRQGKWMEQTVAPTLGYQV